MAPPALQWQRYLNEEWSLEGYFQLVDYPPLADDQPFARYVCDACADNPRLLLMPGREQRLRDPGFRRELADRPEVVFVKTHPPYEQYFPGEGVIQPVRHPGASLWSYYHYLRDVRDLPVTLEGTINGDYDFGDWSNYHAAWNDAAEALDGRLLRVHYEQLFGNELDFCEQLSEFTGLPLLSRALKPFVFYQRKVPKIARSGRADEWQQHYSDQQMALLHQRHAQQMAQLGYTIPNSA